MPRTEAGKALAILVPGNYSDLVATIDAIEAEASIPDRDALAEALAGHDHPTSAGHLRMRRDHLSALLSDECPDAIIAALKEQG